MLVQMYILWLELPSYSNLIEDQSIHCYQDAKLGFNSLYSFVEAAALIIVKSHVTHIFQALLFPQQVRDSLTFSIS